MNNTELYDHIVNADNIDTELKSFLVEHGNSGNVGDVVLHIINEHGRLKRDSINCINDIIYANIEKLAIKREISSIMNHHDNISKLRIDVLKKLQRERVSQLDKCLIESYELTENFSNISLVDKRRLMELL